MIKKSNIDIALFVGVLVILKLALDGVYALHGNTNNVLDILAFKDEAKQYLFAEGLVQKRHLFLISGGGIRAPLESVLLALGSAAFGLARIDLVAYLVALAALAALVWALVAVKAEVWPLLGRPRRPDSSGLLLALLLFAPLTVGLSRSTLVELPQAACIYAVYALCLACVRAPGVAGTVWLNLAFCAGALLNVTFPAYVALPMLAMLFLVARRRGAWKALLASAVFQLIAQRVYAYYIVNHHAILHALLGEAGGGAVRYENGLAYNLLVRGLGLPFFLALALFLLARIGRAGRRASLEDGIVPLVAGEEGAAPERRWSPARVVFALAAINLFLALFMQVSAPNQYLRFFYFALPAVYLGAAFVYESVVPRKLWWAVAGPVALAGVAITALYSLSLQPAFCGSRPYRLLLAQDCNRVEPADGSAYSPVGGRVAAPEALAALKARGVPPGGLVLLVGPNPYNDAAVFTYYARDGFRRDGWTAHFQDLDRALMDQPGAYPAAAAGAVLIEPSNRLFSRTSINGSSPPMLDAGRLQQMKQAAAARLQAMGLVPVARFPNPAGDMIVYAKAPAA